ncbi:MAG: polysaccharide deacetylase family protein [Patescibacteria group bacterium]
MLWSPFLHFYQPHWQKKEIIVKVVRESYSPILKILEKNQKARITLNICGSLTELLVKNDFKEILKRIKKLVENGQIELVGSAIYHPLLPLIPQKEIIRQIRLNENINKKYFEEVWRPKGFFPPEMAYNKKIAKIIQSLGYKWLILDEIAYQGRIGEVSFEKNYRIKRSRLKVVFRNRGLSDIFFTGWLDSEEKFWQALRHDGRCDNFLITAFDGENLGHHKPGTEKIFEKLIKKIKTITISELLKIYQREEIIEPLNCSWASKKEELKRKIFFNLWQHPENPIHQAQWQLTYLVIKEIENSKKDINYKKAKKLLDKAISSDQYWWASATPWWSVEIISQGAEMFIEVLKKLKNLDEKIFKKAEKLKNKIILMAKEWQNSGYAKKLKESYLKNEPIRYFGGKILK